MDVQTLIENIGKKRGHFSRKENRAAKLIEIWPQLETKLIGMIERGGGKTEQARLAYAVLLMMETGIRVGNEGSAEGFVCDNQRIAQKDNPAKGIKIGDILYQHPMHGQTVQTFGLTTLLNEHVKVKRKKIHITFVGKKIVDQSLIVNHPTLLKHLPRGDQKDLFLGINYPLLKKFVKKYVGSKYTPKDLRMAKVNLIFVDKFGNDPHKSNFATATTKSGRKKILSTAIEETAAIIGHTKGVCRSAYLSKPLLNFILS